MDRVLHSLSLSCQILRVLIHALCICNFIVNSTKQIWQIIYLAIILQFSKHYSTYVMFVVDNLRISIQLDMHQLLTNFGRSVNIVRNFSRCFVSNVSKKKLVYTFESASSYQLHPKRIFADGTDRSLITSNLIALTDHGNGKLGKHQIILDDTFATKLLKVMKWFITQQFDKYINDPYSLICDAVQSTKEDGACTLTACFLHPDTGDLSFYYIGDSLYGIFQEKRAIMVEGLYTEFNCAKKIGFFTDYQASHGFIQTYKKGDLNFDDIIVMGTNGLWNNIGLDVIHHEVRGANSFLPQEKKSIDAVGRQEQIKEPKSLERIANRVGQMAAFCSTRGNYESPLYIRAKKQGVEMAKEGFLDDCTIILARIKKTAMIK